MLVAIDYETNGLEYYRPDFEVKSAAFTWKEGELYKSAFIQGQEEVKEKIVSLINKNHQILVYNYQFEYGVTKYVYGLDLPIYADVQRLVQYYGPNQNQEKISFGLAASVERILGIEDYKAKYHKWIRDNIAIPKNQKPGRFISQLPEDLLAEYNKLDTEFTFRLYDFLIDRFKREKYNWQVDHDLYVKMVKLFCEAKAFGIKVDLDALKTYKSQVENELAQIDQSFYDQHKSDIEIMLANRFTQKRASYKSERGRAKFTWEAFKQSPLAEVNFASSTQLAELIVSTKNKPVAAWSHYNDDGSPKENAKPSFSTKVLSKWGEDTKLLIKRGKRKKVLEFCESLIQRVEESHDGRWHQELKAVGTITGRFAGGGRLNVQGVPRRDKGFMGTLLAEENKMFVGVDLCFPGDTEILTSDGWVSFKHLDKNSKVWQINPSTLYGSWVVPKRIINYTYSGNLITYSTVRGSLTVTEGHKMLWSGQVNHPTRKDKASYRLITKAGIEDFKINSGCHLICHSHSPSLSQYSEDEIALACMLQADCHYDEYRNVYNIEVAKPRKIEAVERLVGKPGIYIPARESNRLPTVKWSYLKLSSNLVRGKEFCLDSLGANQVDLFVKWLCFWDGTKATNSEKTGRIVWTQNTEKNIDIVQKYLVTSGYEAHKNTVKNPASSSGYTYILTIRKSGVIRFNTKNSIRPSGKTKGAEIKTSYHDSTLVGCVEVDSGFILVRQNGKVFVSGNCAGEPTVTTQYTKDKHYALINGGKKFEPYWNADGFLVIDDIYIAGMSMNPTLKEELIPYWNKKYNGKSFVEQWMEDKEVIKEDIKKWRQMAKAMVLGLGYGMQPKKLRFTLQSNGLKCTLEEATETFHNYWKFFSGISGFSKAMQNKAKKDGRLINEFGFRSSPNPRKAYNWIIQSTINPLICIFTLNVLEEAKYAKYVVLIHDEVLFQIPEDKVTEFKEVCANAEEKLNKLINWSVRVRTGFAVGKTLYDAK